ncbi:energy-coupling factor transporter transmembrane component T family protein [Sediminispirochaeta bajacaliforniensis]|uniref:energy-coupling factor transporter transmembrane component T family protein n=1 Tax=Sediminispirochaeta bajacaliforniensis TaxID=148 RepID=UPI00036E3638|nr:energy-coupling factor transporter transmembrane protein EcfT [Sediminispirochaeta bajacaliforniensis]
MKQRELFRFLPGDDPVRGFDPRLKLPMLLLCAFSLAKLPPMAYLLSLLIPTAAAVSAKISPLRAFRESRGLLLIALLLVVATALSDGRPDKGHVAEALLQGCRFLSIVFLAHIAVETTSTQQFGAAVYAYLAPISPRFAAKCALSIALTIRFLPMIFELIDEIEEAKTARGIAACRNPIRRIRTTVNPLFTLLLERSQQLIEALECRGTGRDGSNIPPRLGPLEKKAIMLFVPAATYLLFLMLWFR